MTVRCPRYMPAVYFTSPPYGVVVVDGLSPTGSVVRGRFSNTMDESLDITVSLQSGQLRFLPTYTMDADGLDITVSLQSGQLKDMPAYTMDESLDITVSLQSGQLKDMPVYTMDADGLDITVSLQGGSLV